VRPRDLEKHHLGEWGEKMVLLKLQELGFEVVPKGGFGPHDIEARRPPTGSWLRIEVKTSRWKNEGLRDRDGQRISYWGWLVKSREQTELHFDYLVGVAQVEGQDRTARFFVFTREEANSQPSLDPRPGIKPANVEKKIDLFGSMADFDRARAADPGLFSQLEEHLNQEPSRFEKQWSKIH
jgi:hypothetical protein